MFQRSKQLYFGPATEVNALLNTEMREKRCEVKQLPGVYLRLPQGIAFTYESELIPIFNFYLKQFMEDGQVYIFVLTPLFQLLKTQSRLDPRMRQIGTSLTQSSDILHQLHRSRLNPTYPFPFLPK